MTKETSHSTRQLGGGSRRRFGGVALTLFMAYSLSTLGCAGLQGARTVTLSESELALLLARQFPQERKVLDVVELQMTNPLIRLLPERNRLACELDFEALDRLFGSRAQGHVKLDYALRFEGSDHTFRMHEVRVRDLTLASGSSSLQGAAQRLGSLIAENVLEDMALYKMTAKQADEMNRLGLEAGPIVVNAQGIQMQIMARPR